MSIVKFSACGADVEYELADNATREELRVNGEIIVDRYGDVDAWGKDYQIAVAGLRGAAKDSATSRYLRTKAEALIIAEIFNLREMVRAQEE